MKTFKKIKSVVGGLLGAGMLILLFLGFVGKLDPYAEKISGESDMLRGNDTGPTMVDSTKVVIGDDPVESDNAEVEETTKATEAAAEELESVPSDQLASLEDIFASEEVEEDLWWKKDRTFAYVDTDTGDEVDVHLHWAAEDIGEIQIDLSEGLSTGVCVFETDGMWSYFTYNGLGASFYLDEEDGVENLHLILGDPTEVDEYVLWDLEWLQQNAG